MTLVSFLLLLVVFGVVFYLIDRFVPMAPVFQTVLRIVAVVIALFLVLALFGLVAIPFAIK